MSLQLLLLSNNMLYERFGRLSLHISASLHLTQEEDSCLFQVQMIKLQLQEFQLVTMWSQTRCLLEYAKRLNIVVWVASHFLYFQELWKNSPMWTIYTYFKTIDPISKKCTHIPM
jgi:hypothetical protein